jgi:hypothetical protein
MQCAVRVRSVRFVVYRAAVPATATAGVVLLKVREARGSEVVLRASAGFFALTAAHAECCSLRV